MLNMFWYDKDTGAIVNKWIVSIHTTMHHFADYKKMIHDCTCINQTHMFLSQLLTCFLFP